MVAKFIVLLLLISTVIAITEPPYIPVAKPNPTNTVTVCASGCDYANLEQADQAAQPGWLIQVKAGTYSCMTWDSSGTSGNEIVIEAYGDGDAVFICSGSTRFRVPSSYVIFDGGQDRQLIFDGTTLGSSQVVVYPLGSDHLTLSRINIRNGGQSCHPCTVTNLRADGEYLRIFNSNISGASSVGIYGNSGDYHEIRNNIIRDNGGTGIQYNPHNNPGDSNDEVTIAGNLIFNNGFTGPAGIRPGIALLSNVNELYDVYIYNNIMWNNKKAAISTSGASNLKVKAYHNTIYDNVDKGIILNGGNSEITNNIIFGNGDDSYGHWDFMIGTYNIDLGTVDLSENIIGSWGKTHIDFSSIMSRNLNDDPVFESTDDNNPDYLKLSGTSPALDSGSNLVLNSDYFSNTRPQGSGYDIGAHEYMSGTTCSDPDWFFCEDFENADLVDTDWYYQTPDNTYFPVCGPNQPCADIKNSAMRVLQTAGSTSDQARAYHKIPDKDEFYFKTLIKWEQGFLWNTNRPSHQLYLFGGDFTSPTQTDLTIYLDTTEPPTVKPRLVMKAYNQEQAGVDLQMTAGVPYSGYKFWDWNKATPLSLVDDTWYEFKVHLKLNSFSGNNPLPDGKLELWIDDLLVTSYDDVIFRGTGFDDLKFNRYLVGPNYPPSGPSQSQETYHDSIVFSDYIGCGTEICGNGIDEDCVGGDMVCICGTADTDGDNIVGITELMAHVNNWKMGNIAIADLMQGIVEWKSGC